jgi:hypothetical protein
VPGTCLPGAAPAPCISSKKDAAVIGITLAIRKAMSHYNRVIVGAGTAAAVYLCYYPRTGQENIAVIGEPEPWSRRGWHRMGQPPQMLELPMDHTEHSLLNTSKKSPLDSRFGTPVAPWKAPRRVERLIRHYEQIKESPDKPEDPFLHSWQYARSVQTIIGDYEPIRGRVEQVTGGKPYSIKIKEGDTVTADQVIIASGPGASRMSKAYNKTDYEDTDLYVSGEAFLDDGVTVKKDSVVCVEGGSATAAWAVEKALTEGAKGVFWFTRPDPKAKGLDDRFEAAFPAGGRNDWLKKHGDKIIWSVGAVHSSKVKEGRIAITFENGVVVACDRYVAALGASGGLNLVHPDLRKQLQPIRDAEKHLDPDGNAIVGLATKDGTMLAVGPVMYETQKEYSDSNKYLPRAGRPPEGIPTIIATIGALRRYLGGGQKKWVDFNLQSFTDLDEYFENAVGFFLAAGLGKDTNGFGDYSLKQIVRFVTDQVVGTRIMKSSSFGVSEKEMSHVFDQIWDFAYEHLGAKRQEEWTTMLNAYYDKK